MYLYELIEEFEDLIPEEKLELIVEFSDGLPELSESRARQRPDESHRVQECQSAVYLWVDLIDGRVHLEADVPRQSPTVRGLVSLLVQGLEGASPEEVMAMPGDLLPMLGLQETLGMTRQRGTRAVMARIKREVGRAVIKSAASDE